MDKVKIFEKEIDLIEDCILNDFAQYCIERVPDYFFTMPASTTGKFHPAYSLGEGGLVRHTKAAVKIANDLLNLEQNKELAEYKDEIIFALIFHDSIKKGNEQSKYTVTEHPLLAADFIEECVKDYHLVMDAGEGLSFSNSIKIIQNLIRSHMGQWNSDYRTKKEVMPKPSGEAEKFVHTCDYLASRKYLTCEVE
jgi:hypothetical protein